MAETLKAIAERVAEEAGTSNVLACPERSEGCVERFHCNNLCNIALQAHAAFASKTNRSDTSYNGTRGMLTTASKGRAFETVNGQVEYHT